MTWEIVLGIIALVGFVITISTPINKLTRVMTELRISLEGVKSSVEQLTTKNTESHRRLWEHNDMQDERIDSIEKRTTKIEYDMEKFHGQ